MNTDMHKQQNDIEARLFWQEYLNDMAEASILPQRLKNTDPGHHTYESMPDLREEVSFSFRPETTLLLLEQASQNGVEPAILLQTIWGIVLLKYNNSEQSIFGVSIAGTHLQPSSADTAATPAGTITPVRLITSVAMTFRELLQEAQRSWRLAQIHNVYGPSELQEIAGVSHPLIDHILTLEYGANMASIHSPFSIRIRLEQSLTITLSYHPAVYHRDQMEAVCRHLEQVADTVLHHPNLPVSTISILTPAERQQLIHTFNSQTLELPVGQTVHELFEKMVQRQPDDIAVVFGEQSLTYRQLNSQANQLARVLRRRGAGPDQVIAIMAAHSLEMIVGVLGIVKAGAAYLPIDPSYPAQRTAYMLEDSRTTHLLIQPGVSVFPAYQRTAIPLEESVWRDEEDHNVEPIHQGHHLAYVIYTSGSTGQPKGVMIEHHTLVNLCIWHNHTFQTGPADRSTKLAGFGFDASVWETFPPLLCGMTLHVINENMRGDIYALQKYCAAHDITITFLPTQLAVQFMELDHPSLRLLLIGGERIQQFQPQSYAVVNNYGPTENTVVTTSGVLDAKSPVLTIGKPVSNHRVYILDRTGQLQPVGVPGELCVSGSGLARGYLHRPELTAERFTEHPAIPGERIYRTGDLARWLPDGQIEYLGRLDEQVKIRGYRIEPGEIDVQLMKHSSVRECLTIARQDQEGHAYLCTYIVAARAWTTAELRAHILQTLPEYMIPAHFVQMDQLPITANGKVNKSALPEPQFYSPSVSADPGTATEIKLAAIFKDVLGVPQAGRDDHFFEMGGHSLKAMTMVSRIYREMNVDIPLNEVFLKPTIKELAAYIDQTESTTFESISKAPEQEYYPVSSAQRRMYMVQNIQQTATTGYNIPLVFEMKGKLDAGHLQSALQMLIQRHESLRTSFHMVEGELMQRIHTYISWNMEIYETTSDQLQTGLLGLVRPFDLAHAPLFRAGLFRIGQDHHVLMLDMHHIIADGVSSKVLLEDLMQLYQGRELPALSLQYRDYAVWQQSQMNMPQWREHQQYWLQQFEGELPVLELPTDYPRPSVQEYSGDVWRFRIDARLTRDMEQLCLKHGVTLHMLMLAVFHLLLSRYTGQQDMITGSPIAGRLHADVQPIVGMFVNLLALRTQPAPGQSFTDYLTQCKATILQAYTHADYPFEELVEQLELQRDVGRHPLFDVLFTVQNFEKSTVHVPDLEMNPIDLGWNPSKFAMNWTVVEGESLDVAVEYSTHLFRSSTIRQMTEHYTELLRQIVDQPERNHTELTMITAEEREQLIVTFNQTSAPYPREQTIHELFERQCRLDPQRPAVIMEDQQLTYAELNTKANQLAHTLIQCGVKENQIVGLITERSPEMIVSILAILKAGAAYLPVDPTHPVERIRHMLTDSEAPLVIVQHRELWTGARSYEGDILYLSDQPEQSQPVHSPSMAVMAEQLAYVMYTSGSTGQPKGVMVTHRNVVKTVVNNGFLEITPEDRILQLSNYAFDGSTFDIHEALLHGAALVLVTREQLLNPVALIASIREQHISVALMTVALFNTLVEVDLDGLRGLRKLLFGGEQASRIHVEKALRTLGEGTLINVYGPTEATVCAAAWLVNQAVLDTGQLPIGPPIHNTTLYILNSSMQPQPIGVTGELWIGGEGVSAGYLRRPELTAERFIENPWMPGTCMYRSGDLARWLPDGNVDYQGRIDEQVKIRGNRIELGEIEAGLLEHPAVQEAVVLALKKGLSYSSLCAYIVTTGEWTDSELKTHLNVRMPDYMIPSRFMAIEQLPLTSNGKVDKRALPVLHIDEEHDRVAPRTETETRLIRIAAEVLEMTTEQISVTDNLFDIGGHSLSILKMIGKVHTIGWKLEMKDFYIYRSFTELARKIDTGNLHAEVEEPRAFTPGIPVPVPSVRVQGRSSSPQSILLLGATGFLGIHVLHELLTSTTARITCLIRARNIEQAHERLEEKLQFYFATVYSRDRLAEWMNRIDVRHGDIAEPGWGWSDTAIQTLGESVEAVIHTAALVKHYGFYEEFERVNVQGTRHAADFCARFSLPLHYVSTLSVSGSYAPESQMDLPFTEKDLYIGQDYYSNVYLRSKFEAEALLVEKLRQGLDVSIYRVGNLTGRYTDGRFQENIQENMFYLSLKALAMMEGAEPAIMQEKVDLTPVDVCAAAIVRLMHNPELPERVFHLHNPYYARYADIYEALTEQGFRQTTMSREERETRRQELQSRDEVLAGIVTTLFESTEPINIRIDVKHTVDILDTIGFAYPIPDMAYFRKMIAYAVQAGFMDPQQHSQNFASSSST
ncbi:amino acid adenylation domain-containing protein [Paenibacillus sp. Z6-24]